MCRSLGFSLRPLDAVGLSLVALVALWVGFVAGGDDGRPAPVLLLLSAMVVATTVGRMLAGRPGLAPGLVAVGVTGSMVLTWPGVLHPGGAPLGYANGNATLASLGLVAALGAALSESDPALRRGWIGLAGLLGFFAVATGSVAGVLALIATLGLVVLSASTRWAGFAIVGGLVAVSLTVGVTSALALGSDIGGLGNRVATRGQLWAAAAEMIDDEPLRGIGAGEFAERNPVSTDADLRWAHNGYLQVAAEYGLVGLLLVASVAGWVWATLWTVAARRPAAAALAAAAVTIVALHATVDYVWHLPPVLLITSILFGSGSSLEKAAQCRALPATAAEGWISRRFGDAA